MDPSPSNLPNKNLPTTNLAFPLRSCQINNTSKAMFRPYLCRNPVSSPVADFSRRMFDITLGYSHQGSERRVAEANQVTRQPFREAFPPAFMGFSRWARRSAQEGKRRPLSSRVTQD